MKLILQERIPNLGHIGDLVNVKAGYARNYLIPSGKALVATAANMADFELRRAELEKQAKAVLTLAQKRADALDALDAILITEKASEEGKLFGSVSEKEIVDALIALGVEVTKQEVALPEGAIRQVGDYEVNMHLHTDVVAKISVTVAAE